MSLKRIMGTTPVWPPTGWASRMPAFSSIVSTDRIVVFGNKFTNIIVVLPNNTDKTPEIKYHIENRISHVIPGGVTGNVGQDSIGNIWFWSDLPKVNKKAGNGHLKIKLWSLCQCILHREWDRGTAKKCTSSQRHLLWHRLSLFDQITQHEERENKCKVLRKHRYIQKHCQLHRTQQTVLKILYYLHII